MASPVELFVLVLLFVASILAGALLGPVAGLAAWATPFATGTSRTDRLLRRVMAKLGSRDQGTVARGGLLFVGFTTSALLGMGYTTGYVAVSWYLGESSAALVPYTAGFVGLVVIAGFSVAGAIDDAATSDLGVLASFVASMLSFGAVALLGLGLVVGEAPDPGLVPPSTTILAPVHYAGVLATPWLASVAVLAVVGVGLERIERGVDPGPSSFATVLFGAGSVVLAISWVVGVSVVPATMYDSPYFIPLLQVRSVGAAYGPVLILLGGVAAANALD